MERTDFKTFPLAHPAPGGRGALPHDHPTPARSHRVYVALTNHCNRACPWCSTYSSPAGNTWITWNQLAASLPAEGAFEVQLEGGEPTLHPQFRDFVTLLRANPRCGKIILCTNGVVLPRRVDRLRAWLSSLGEPLLVKLSINHHLLEHDEGLLSLAQNVQRVLIELGGAREVVFNVRLRPGSDGDIRSAVTQAGLEARANVFYLQRYGLASGEREWDDPFLAGHNFRMVNPDGRVYGADLIARSEGMGQLK